MALNATGATGAASAAFPYGAAIGAASGVLQSALADTPTSVTSGSGSYQSGPFQIGNKQVGGKGNSAGATQASQSQTPLQPAGTAADPTTAQSLYGGSGNQTTLLIAGGIALLAVVLVIGTRR